MEIRKRDLVTVVSSPDMPGLEGKTGEAWPRDDGGVDVDGIRDAHLDLVVGPPTFRPEQLRKA